MSDTECLTFGTDGITDTRFVVLGAFVNELCLASVEVDQVIGAQIAKHLGGHEFGQIVGCKEATACERGCRPWFG